MALHEELRKQGDFLFRYRSHLPLLLLAVGLWIPFHQRRFGADASETLIAEALEACSLWVGLLGLAIRVFAVGYTPSSTSGRNTKQGQVAGTLNTTGAYSLTRNPLYLGNYLLWAAVAMATSSLWFVLSFTLAFWLYYERIVFAEEAFLRRKFGATYLDWAARTPAFLPRHLHYVHPSTRFSWRKVAKKEKNGLFALFLTLCVIRLAGDLAEGEVSLPEESLSIAAAVGSGALYCSLRALKRHTAILDEEGR